MKFFHINDQTRSLQVVVEAGEFIAGTVVCTTTDWNVADQITKLLNQERSAVLARCAALENQPEPPPCYPAPVNEDPELSEAKRGGR